MSILGNLGSFAERLGFGSRSGLRACFAGLAKDSEKLGVVPGGSQVHLMPGGKVVVALRNIGSLGLVSRRCGEW